MKWSRNLFMRAMRPAALTLAFVLVSAGMGAAAPFDENRPKVGEEARGFEIQGFKLSELKGRKNLVLVFYRGHF